MPRWIKPAGVGELRVIRSQLARYEPGAIAHIENVLSGEERLREHRWRHLSERSLELESEQTTESLQDLQSVERHELEREMESQSRSEFNAKAGFSLSASYGGTVTLGLSAEIGTSETREQSQRSAERYAKELTARTVERITTRVRQLQRTRTLDEAEELNRHGFANTAADSRNVTGVYRWVDAVYRSKLELYGQRLFYDFMVPEPAAYLRQVTALKHDLRGEVLAPPVAPTALGRDVPLSPDHIGRSDYAHYVAAYGAAEVPPPPPEFLTVAHTVVEEREDDGSFPLIFSDKLEIPAGYRAAWAYVPEFPVTRREQDHRPVASLVSLGAHTLPHVFEGNEHVAQVMHDAEPHATHRPREALTYRLGRESGTLPMVGERVADHPSVALAVEVLCVLDEAHFEKWQLEVYACVMRAYQAALGAYEDRLLAARLEGTAAIGGLNPEFNQRLALQELKRSCLSMWIEGDPAATNSLRPPGAADTGTTPPRINVTGAVAEGRRVRFLESAFEWDNARVELYPYFWGRAEQWVDMLQSESPDERFQAFLQAGSARVSVPCRPEMAAQVLFYQLTSIMWDAGEPPVIVPGPGGELTAEEALYNSYLDDLADDTQLVDLTRQTDIAVDDADAWLVRVPTSAVWLAPDGRLPDLDGERAAPAEG